MMDAARARAFKAEQRAFKRNRKSIQKVEKQRIAK